LLRRRQFAGIGQRVVIFDDRVHVHRPPDSKGGDTARDLDASR
jgi:hypothetical protein